MSFSAPASGKLFLGGITPNTTTEAIRSYFSQFGEVNDAVAMMKDGCPRGFGFVTMANPSILPELLQQSHTIDEKVIDVKEAQPGGGSKPAAPTKWVDWNQPVYPAPSPQPSGVPGKAHGAQKGNPSAKIFVGGIGEITHEQLVSYFGQFGNVVDSVVMTDKATGRPRGFGFISYDSPEVIAAMPMGKDLHCIEGIYVDVKAAVPGGKEMGGGKGGGSGGCWDQSFTCKGGGGCWNLGGYNNGCGGMGSYGKGCTGGYGKGPPGMMGGKMGGAIGNSGYFGKAKGMKGPY